MTVLWSGVLILIFYVLRTKYKLIDICSVSGVTAGLRYDNPKLLLERFQLVANARRVLVKKGNILAWIISGCLLFISYRYTSNLPEKPDWKRKLELVEDKVKSNNHDPKSERYKAFEKLEDTYYAMGVRNRAKYTTVSQVYAALSEKYSSDYYKQFSELEVTAMYDNELHMTLYGCLNGVAGHNRLLYLQVVKKVVNK